MAHKPKIERKLLTKRDRAEKEIKKIQQQIKQAHRLKPEKRTTVTNEENVWKKVNSENKLSPTVLKAREQKAEQRAEKQKALMLKFLKEQKRKQKKLQ